VEKKNNMYMADFSLVSNYDPYAVSGLGTNSGTNTNAGSGIENMKASFMEFIQ